MKKFVKVMLIISCVFAIFGIGLSLGGVAMGAATDENVVAGIRKNVKNAASLVKVDFDWDDDDDWDDSGRDYLTEDYSVEDAGNKVYTFDAVREIEIDLHYDELVMQAYDGDAIKVEIENDENDNVRVRSSSGKLKIESRKKLKNRTVVLSYPKNAEFAKVEISIDAGTGSLLDDLKADELDISVGAGDFTSSGHIISTKTELEAGVGSLEISGLTAREISGECGIGELRLGLSGKQSDYNYELECGIGEINFDGERYSGLANEKKITNSSASCKLELECGMGEINVDFAN